MTLRQTQDWGRWIPAVVGAAAVVFVAFYPALAAWRLAEGSAWAYQGLLPNWDSGFFFNSNQQPVPGVSVLSPGVAAVLATAIAVVV
ncbi:MAG TPA: hypothetical protein VNP97_14555, partial [Microbacterium sp.]|nr:hypothetical protein [Microbacterium sp.]